MEPVGYHEDAPAAALVPYVRCTWWHRPMPTAVRTVVLPDACLDLVWDRTRLFVAGPDTGPAPVAHGPGRWFAGVRFQPGAASAVLGVPASALLDQRVDLDRLDSDTAHRLVDRLAASDGAEAAAAVLAAEVARWAAAAAPPDPLVARAVRDLATGPRKRPVANLADDLGVTSRQLLRRCNDAVGYGPKVLDRVLRFRRFLDAGPVPGRLAAAAADAGYADQAHLVRDCRRLAGMTPTALLA